MKTRILDHPGAFSPQKETACGHLQVVRITLEPYGRPQAYYMDQHRIFRFVEHQGIHGQYHLEPDEADSQVKRALRMLDIGFVCLHYPRKVKKDETFSFQARIYKLRHPELF